MNKVGIILVLYNQNEIAKYFICSLKNQEYDNYILYIVDNNSNEGELDYIMKICNEFMINTEYIPLNDNLGYGTANNIGAQRAVNDKCEYIIISNPDIEMEENCIKTLIDEIEKCEKTGVIGPVVMYGSRKENSNVIQSFGAGVNFIFQKHKIYFQGRRLSNEIIDFQEKIDYVSGTFFMIKNEVIKKCRLFPEDYFMYNEEIDLARRLKKSGYKVAVTSKTKVWHNHQEDKTHTSKYFKYYYMMRNRMLYFKNYRLYPQMFLYLVYQLITFPFKLKWSLNYANKKLLYYYYLGLVRGILGEKNKSNIKFY